MCVQGRGFDGALIGSAQTCTEDVWREIHKELVSVMEKKKGTRWLEEMGVFTLLNPTELSEFCDMYISPILKVNKMISGN